MIEIYTQPFKDLKPMLSKADLIFVPKKSNTKPDFRKSHSYANASRREVVFVNDISKECSEIFTGKTGKFTLFW